MKKDLEPGSVIAFRLPSDTPDDLIAGLNRLKSEVGDRKMSATISPWILKAFSQMLYHSDSLQINIPVNDLTADQKKWLDSPITQQMIIQLAYQLAQGSQVNTESHAQHKLPSFSTQIHENGEKSKIPAFPLDENTTESDNTIKEKKKPEYSDQALKMAKALWNDDD